MRASGPLRDELTVDALDTLVVALREALQPEVTTRAQEVAGRARSAHRRRTTRERIRLADRQTG